MLTNLNFQNFKSWKDTGDIRFAPLTGFFGANSSGKTAILQLLLMLKQTIDSKDEKRVLQLGDDNTYVDLGTSYNIVYQHKIPSILSYSLSWKHEKTITFLRDDDMAKFRKPEITYQAKVEFLENRVKLIDFCYQIQSEESNLSSKVGMRLSRENGNKYSFFIEGDELRRVSRQRVSENDLEDEIHLLIKSYDSADINFPTKLVKSFEDLFHEIHYLGPLREYPKRIYSWSGEGPHDVGKRGEFAIHALLSSQAQSQSENNNEPTVQVQVGNWLRRLGLIYDFRLQAIAENRREYEVCVRRNKESAEVSINDVGFGVSQILPVLTLCYYVPKGSTIILEQPEIHLHPSVQAGLADVFIDVIKTRNIQILLESHSEHLLRRLQRRIAEESHNMTNMDTALYFCELNSSGESNLYPLDLDEFGNINNWPKGLFGDEMGELVAMTEAAMNRQQRGE